MTPPGPSPSGPPGVLRPFSGGGVSGRIWSLRALEAAGRTKLDRLPFSIRVLLENALRHMRPGLAGEPVVDALARWAPRDEKRAELPFMPSRVVLQDFTGVPCVVDLAGMRDAMARLGGDPQRINPVVPADLVIDHSVQVDIFGTPDAFERNVALEFDRNRERYLLLRWAQRAFRNFRVVPPGTGIVHQVNLEYLATVVAERDGDLFPDTCVGTDSHTTMINGLGVVGWGVGGIEAEAVLLGQPYPMLVPDVTGVRLTGALPAGATATDLVLTVTEMLRRHGVVGRFVEFFGPGLTALALPDRATIANMSPEYGATIGFFPVDAETLRYLRASGRDEMTVARVEAYCREQGLFRTEQSPDPEYTDTLALDLATIEPSLAGPRRPQDRVPLGGVPASFRKALPTLLPTGRTEAAASTAGGGGVATAAAVSDGSVVIAAITSCTNTSNPSVMIGAGLLAKKAVEAGLDRRPWVKTSLAPGSRVVTDYLEASGTMAPLEKLGFNLVGYGCTTCIGNSGPLPHEIHRQIEENKLVVAAVLSGNRNFEARIHPLVRANYLASPMLVVAYALAGSVDTDLAREPLGSGKGGRPIYLKDIWPSPGEIAEAMAGALSPEQARSRYGQVFEGDARWKSLPVPEGGRYAWDPASTYVASPPFYEGIERPASDPPAIRGARVLALLGDSVTTDHISPAGSISASGPAGRWLQEHGVPPADFNTYGARRGHHEVMIRGTFANTRIRNQMTDREGGWALHLPTGETVSIFEAATRYAKEGTPLVVLAGKEYGTGSSRDWAAKGTMLLGVRAVIAETYERIHRSNLVGMGVLPLQYRAGENAASLGLSGKEAFDIDGFEKGITPGMSVTVRVRAEGGPAKTFQAILRVDSPVEAGYIRNGGILPAVLRELRAHSGGEGKGGRSTEGSHGIP